MALCLSLAAPLPAQEPDPLEPYVTMLRDPDASGTAKRARLDKLMDDMSATGALEPMVRALAELPFWAATDTDARVSALFEAAAAGEISGDLARRAVRRADGQLDSLLRGAPPLEVYRRLTALEAAGEDYPLDYRLLLQLYRVGAVEEAIMAVPAADISAPFPDWARNARTAEISRIAAEGIAVLDGMIATYAGPDFADRRERFFLNDLRHRAALLRFLTGDETWPASLREIVASAGDKAGWFDPDGTLDHIYVDQFFALRDQLLRTSAEVGTEVLNTGPQDQGTIPGLRVRRNFNPAQLAIWTCDTLSRTLTEDLSIVEVLALLGGFENADYRVVLAHHDGTAGRFSGAPLADLRTRAQAAMADLPAKLRQPQSDFAAAARRLAGHPICGPLVAGIEIAPADLVEGRVAEGNAYLAIGGTLSADEAVAIETHLLESPGKEAFRDGGPYLLRPGTNG